MNSETGIIKVKSLEIPTDWAGKTIQVLAFFIASGSVGAVDAKNQVSDTTFGGAFALRFSPLHF